MNAVLNQQNTKPVITVTASQGSGSDTGTGTGTESGTGSGSGTGTGSVVGDRDSFIDEGSLVWSESDIALFTRGKRR